MIGFSHKLVAFLFYGHVFFFVFWLPVSNQIDQNRTPFAVKRQGIFKIAFAYDIFGLDAGQLLHGPVPCDHPAVIVDHPGWIRQEVDDLGEALFRIFDGFFCSFTFGNIV